MNTYVQFSATRKTLIAHLKPFLKDPANRPYKDETYGTKYSRLFLEDYAVYAVLRGKDYRKTSHLADGANARSELECVLMKLKRVIEKPEALASYRKAPRDTFNRYFDADAGIEAVQELASLIEAALVK